MALETGIGGGSFSIFRAGRLVADAATDFSDLKADDLIEKISNLLQKRDIKKSKLEKIFYSENPGSQTGLKIGAAVSKGLSLSLNIGITGRDLFECILKTDQKRKPAERIIILPVNRQFSAWKHFDAAGVSINSGRNRSDQNDKICIK